MTHPSNLHVTYRAHVRDLERLRNPQIGLLARCRVERVKQLFLRVW